VRLFGAEDHAEHDDLGRFEDDISVAEDGVGGRMSNFCWRWRRDSNPGRLAPHTLSRRAP
jgi:hypothetical protein